MVPIKVLVSHEHKKGYHRLYLALYKSLFLHSVIDMYINLLTVSHMHEQRSMNIFFCLFYFQSIEVWNLLPPLVVPFLYNPQSLKRGEKNHIASPSWWGSPCCIVRICNEDGDPPHSWAELGFWQSNT